MKIYQIIISLSSDLQPVSINIGSNAASINKFSTFISVMNY